MRIKIIMILMTAAFLHVSATNYAQKITLTKKNTTLVNVFKEIQKQSGYDFIYPNRLIKKAQKISINVTNAPLTEVLQQCFEEQPFGYFINDKTIIIRENKQAVAIPKSYLALNIDITGKVKDENGQPLPGATIKIKGSQSSVASDQDGNFLLTDVLPSTTLVVSFMGFATQEIVVGNSRSLEIILKEDTKALSEVVVVGYGTVQKRDLTGAVSRVTAEDIKNIPITRVDQMLQGRATGVEVKSTNGTPGAGTTIRIRGARSIEATNEPLYVIDGLIDAANLNSVNPQDIASIEILKDASATAIYGARAANGVVLVTTKKGKPGKDAVNFNVIAGVQKLPQTLDLMNAREFVDFINEARKEGGKPLPYPDVEAAIAKVGEEGTNWTEAVTRPAGYKSYNISTSGGTNKLTYFVSGNVVDQDGIVLNTDFKKYQGRINLNKSFSDKLKMGLVLNASRYRIEKGDVNFGSNLTWFSNMITLAPTIPLYKADGTYESYNPIFNLGAESDVVTYVAKYVRNNNTVNDLQSNLFLEYELLKGLKIKTSFGTSLSTNKENKTTPSQMPTKIANKTETATAESRTGSSIYVLNENILTYDRKIGEHHFNVLGGFTYENKDNNNMWIQATNLTDDVMLYNNFGASATTNRNVTSGAERNTKISYLGRTNYDYKSKYYFTATGRYDGASNFAAKHKWGFFPSMGLKWRLSEEDFFKKLNSKSINNLAFRFSYGLSGNQGVGNYESLARMGNNATAYVFGGNAALGFTQTGLENNELTWETSAQMDIGTDVELFNGRLTLDANYYKINTRDLLLTVQLPTQTGFGSTLVNLGKTETKGLEFAISGDIIKSKTFSWNSSFNIATNQQKILDLGPLVRVNLDDNNYGAVTNIMEVGVPIGAQYGVIYMGTWKNQEEINAELAKPAGQRTMASNGSMYKPGKPRYKDTNGDGLINATDYEYLGTPNPTVYGGFGNTFRYKKLSLDAFLQFNAGNKMYNNIEFFMGSGSDLTNQFAYMADRWTPTNNTSDIPAVNSRDNIPSTRLLHDASLIRLKSVQLSYDFKSTFPKLFRECEVFLTGTNLLKFSKYNGFDPEVNSSTTSSKVRARDDGNYPNARTFAVGINVGL